MTIVGFGDFECPYSKRAHATLQQLIEAYPKELRIVWKDYPRSFHPRARPAAALARLAYRRQGDAGFWKAHQELFASQAQLGDEQLRVRAGKLGLAWSAVKSAIEHEDLHEIDRSVALAGDVDARATPHFFVNGVRLAGAQPFDKFQGLVDRELAKARVLVENGVERADLYDRIIRDGLTLPKLERRTAPPPRASSPSKGAADASVVLEVWSEFGCSACRDMAAIVGQIEAEYRGRLKIAWRHRLRPEHAGFALAAEAAQEAFAQRGNDGFWSFHDRLFQVQDQPGALERSNLEQLATEASLDVAKLRAVLDSRKHEKLIQADNDFATAGGIGDAPSFTVSGYYATGIQTLGALRRLVDHALADAKAN